MKMVRMLHSKKNRTRRGFTLIELLVVVLILSVLMAVAAPLYLSAVADSQRKTCRANMQTIANAVQAARVKTAAANYSAFIGSAINSTNEPDLLTTPVCPSGGAYSIANGNSGDNTTFKVSCTGTSGGTAHGTFQPGVDSN